MKIGRFVQNPFNEHLVLTHKPNKVIKKKKKKNFPTFIFLGKKLNQKAFRMVEVRFQSKNTE